MRAYMSARLKGKSRSVQVADKKQVTERKKSIAPERRELIAPSTRPGFTLRIFNIPTAISKDQFIKTIRDLPNNTQANEQNVLGWSLTASAVSADALAGSSQVATVTFRSAPFSFQYSPIPQVPDLGNAIFDFSFFGMTPLSNPSRPVADIIAITGLAGHAFGSWKSRGASSAMWLRDFLPGNVPNVRILTYGYDSTLLDNSSNASIHEFSELFFQALATVRASEEEKSRPIIFIAHSLGGLVIKHVLCNHRSVLTSCHALLLFGVPHRGLNVAALRSMVNSQSNEKLIEDLDESSSYLRLLEQFWRSHPTTAIKIISIYETKPTPTVQSTPQGWKRTGPEVLMVEKNSATAATLGERADHIFPIDRNHSDIVKFDDQGCQYYQIVRKIIEDLVKGVQDKESQWVPLERKRRVKVLLWLSTIEFSDHHSFNHGRRQQGSGTWLLKNEMWKRWATGDESSILWLRGDAGSGKTMLASFVIDTLKVEAESKNHMLAYFYCDYKEPRRREPAFILNTIIKQFCLKAPSDQNMIPKVMLDEYNKREDEGHSSGALNTNECKDLLLALSGQYLQTTIIIDALDECNYHTRGGLFNALKCIASMSRSKVKILITSRYDDDIDRVFSGTINYYIQAEDNKNDIDRFIEEEVNRRCEPKRLRDTDLPLLSGKVVHPDLRDEIISTLKSKAGGMFLWAQLQILALCKERTDIGVRKALQELPETMTETYNRMLYPGQAVYSDRDRLQRHQIIRFIMCGNTRCSGQLLVQALAIQPDQVTLDESLLSLNDSDILAVCQNFVIYNNVLKCMEFAHFSVKEYLLRTEGFDDRACHNMMAAICLNTLLFHNRNENVKEIVRYATCNWYFHLQRADCLSKEISKVWKQFLTDSAPYRDWLLAIEETDHEVQSPSGQVLSPFWLACYYKLLDIARAMIDDDADVNQVNKHGQSPLSLAIKRGDPALMELLLACDKLDVNFLDTNGRNALSTTIGKGDTTLVKLLLACDKVDVNYMDKNNQRPLLLAVELLLNGKKLSLEEDGTEPNPSPQDDPDHNDYIEDGKTKMPPLHTTEVSGDHHDSAHREIMTLLLVSHRIDMNMGDSYGRTPLICAASHPDGLNIMKVLVQDGRADVNCRDHWGQTPLSHAARRDHSRAVELLLASEGIDVNIADNNGRTPLSHAAGRGMKDSLQALLKCNRVDVNKGDNNGWTPLAYVAMNWEERIAPEVLQNTEHSFYNKAELHVRAMVMLLASDSLDINSASKDGRTILSYAAEKGYTCLVELFLRNNEIDVTLGDHRGQTPILYAATNGHMKVVQLLKRFSKEQRVRDGTAVPR